MMNPFAGIFSAVSSWFGDARLWSSVDSGRKTVSSEYVSEEKALNYSAVWCATQLLCGTGASLPLPLYSGLMDEDRAKEREHPVYRILNGQPNREQTAYSFRSLMWQWQVNWGNAYAEIERQGNSSEGRIVALWPLHPSRVKVERDENRELVYEVRDESGGGKTYLDPWQMFHVPSIVTHDGIVGHGVIEHARESIGAGIAMEKYGANWFGSGGGVPRVVIEHPAKWDDQQRRAFREEWSAIYGGPEGQKVAVLGGGAKATPLSLNAEDSQFLQTRQFAIEEIARWYRVPPHMLQHLLRATYSNVEHLGIEFVQYSLIPWLRLWEQAIWQKLLTQREKESLFAEHNVDALLRGDSAARGAFYHQGINDGWLSRNEVRKFENLTPVDGGDTYYVQGAIVPLDDDGHPVQPTAAEPVAPPMPAGTGNEDAAAASLRRILKRDLRRMLTKETNAVTHAAKKDSGFVQRIDEFYSTHTLTLAEAITEPANGLAQCGVNIDPAVFAATWTQAGKSAVLEASGTATNATELATAVQRLVESKLWADRPETCGV